MAKDETKKLSLEDEKIEKDRQAREKKEEEELKKKHAEKLKKRKEKEARIKKKHKKEAKRVRTLINLPFKLLLQVAMAVTSLSFITMYFGMNKNINDTVLYSFFIFVLLYVGIGIIMISMFFLVSEDKIVEMEELRKLDEERKALEKKKEEEELAHMVELEKEIAAKKLAGKSLREESPEIFFNDTNEEDSGQIDFISSSYTAKQNDDINEMDLNEQQYMYSENDLDPFSSNESNDDFKEDTNLLGLEAPNEFNSSFEFDNFGVGNEKVQI